MQRWMTAALAAGALAAVGAPTAGVEAAPSFPLDMIMEVCVYGAGPSCAGGYIQPVGLHLEAGGAGYFYDPADPTYILVDTLWSFGGGKLRMEQPSYGSRQVGKPIGGGCFNGRWLGAGGAYSFTWTGCF